MTDQLTTLVSLAILKVDLDETNRDYLDYMQSLVVHVLNAHKPDLVTDDIISQLLLQDFGLQIPLRGSQLVLRRMVKKGLLQKTNNLYTISGNLPLVDFHEKRKSAQRNISDVYEHLKLFVKSIYGFDWSESDISRALFAFLSRFGVDFLRAYVFKTSLPHVPLSAPREQYIVGKFIKTLHEEDNPVFDSVIILVKGHMYSNALVCPDLESIEKKFNKLTFYIDTALALNYLKLQGDEEHQIAEELFSLIRHLKGKIAIFEHTIDEIRRVLLGAEQKLDDPLAEGKLIQSMRRNEYKRSELILLRENLIEHLKEQKFIILPTPAYKIDLQISEAELEEAISSKVHYRNPDAIKHDINSVRSIYVLRGGKVPRRLEDAVAVFVTTNTSFAEAAFEVGKNHNSTKEVSSVITDYSLANVAWLKAPLGAPELPTKELMAACYAAMEPTASLWTKYLRELDLLRLKGTLTPDDHALLRASPVVAKELMDLTLGNEEALSGGSIRIILERVKADLVKEKEQALAVGEKELRTVTAERNILRLEAENLKTNIFWYSQKIAKICFLLVKVIALILLFFIAFASSFITTPFVVNSRFYTSIFNILILTGGFLTFLKFFFDFSLPRFFKQQEKSFAARLHKLLSAKFLSKIPK
ncbi:hypothetical protein [Syntrophobacter fumaroxidans]|uniref:Uncharacterized protein n=1 Tax=Syntrophobacter fumaroxidans (strain DSM 10017 / MPOB) TaxID=335543 RepID=A0LJI3_SYNFM|nr:hypothetical protein [Syntrophobacter fumaroxidans]ABK17585.1 hypothetical protein Sfum_1900 [Syntrophobacter fumaroxidans MPOB]